MKSEQEQIKRAGRAIGTGIKEQQKDQIRAAFDQVTGKGKTPKEILGLNDAMIEGIYGQAYRLYNTGKYKEAIQVFRLLIMINASEPKYAMGLAACFHMLKQYKDAADAYTVVAVIDPDNPIPFYHMSDCYVQMGSPLSAAAALDSAVTRSGEKPEYRVLKERALLLMQSLQKEATKAKPM